MTVAAIDRGMTLIRGAVLAALTDYTVHWGMPVAKYSNPRLIWRQATQGAVKNYIGMPASWIGELSLIAQANQSDTAQDLLNAATALVSPVIDIADDDYTPGWTLKLRSVRPVIGALNPTVTTVGVIYHAELRPKDVP